ncbi:MAG: hypothetical protein ACE5DS_04335, partial [Kiloniellaceae bacterium]
MSAVRSVRGMVMTAWRAGRTGSRSMTERRERLQRWLSGVLPRYNGDLEPASEDASFRRYFRIHSDGLSRIVMDAPPDKED